MAGRTVASQARTTPGSQAPCGQARASLAIHSALEVCGFLGRGGGGSGSPPGPPMCREESTSSEVRTDSEEDPEAEAEAEAEPPLTVPSSRRGNCFFAR